jgi:UDP-glucose 4-epimerase
MPRQKLLKKNGLNKMKKILLTGSEGFIGKNLQESLTKRNDFILSCPRQAELNLTDSLEVAEWMQSFQPDVIIHSATSNTVGKGYNSDVCEQNLRMFFNLLRYRPNGCMIYSLCSGSSYNRENWVEKMEENYLGTHIPTDGQGFSKFIIASHARYLSDVVTLRLFGIFGEHEDYRYKFISNTIAKRLTEVEVTLYRNAVYDYLDVVDFCTILQNLIDCDIRSGEFNVTPDNSVALSQIIETVDHCLDIALPYSVTVPGYGTPYTGSNKELRARLSELTFSPIEKSIRRLINYYKNNMPLIDKVALEQDQLLRHAQAINKP